MRPPHILSFDIETAEHMHLGGKAGQSDFDSFREGLETLLDLLKQKKVRATFFVVGKLAEKHPDLIRRIPADDHELALHGWRHDLVYKMTPAEFENDLAAGKRILENISGKKIIGYRAPSWSVDEKKTPWFWGILKKNGFEYSSSLFPLKTPLYGDNAAPRFPHIRRTTAGEILELPISTAKFFVNLPFSGGAYFRLLFSWQRRILEYFWQKNNLPIIYYFHLRDLDLEKIPPGLSLSGRAINYAGKGMAGKRFRVLVQSGQFTTISSSLPLFKDFVSKNRHLPVRYPR